MTVRRILVWGLCGALVAAAAAYAARRPLLTAIGAFLIVQDDPRPADAIVVLSGSIPDRMLEAVDLYKDRVAPRIILTREPPLPGLEALRARGGALPERFEQNVTIGEQLGVPAAAISVVATPASSTLAEAQAVMAFLRPLPIHSIVLVTSKAHTRRAAMIFRSLAAGRLSIAVCPSRYDPFAPATWFHDRALVRRVVIEYGKLLNYLLIDRWRARAPAGGAT